MITWEDILEFETRKQRSDKRLAALFKTEYLSFDSMLLKFHALLSDAIKDKRA